VGEAVSYFDLAAKIIEEYEGLRLKAYKCPAGVWTIGYGHTHGVFEGEEIEAAIADSYLLDDMMDADHCLFTYVETPLSEEQRAALISFVFNLGCGAFRGSMLLKLLNHGDYAAAAQQFSRWTKAGGHELAGLVRRRDAERRLFEEQA
jgi:lysozyme